MELREMYGMYLHGESLDAMQATERQKKLIAAFDMYSDVEEMIRDIKHLDVTRTRHLAGIEFCGAAPFRKYAPEKITDIIKAVKEGQSPKKAAEGVGMTREWARKLLIANGFTYDPVDKKWTQHEGMSIKSFHITGDEHRNKSTPSCLHTESEPKINQLIKYLTLGASLNKAASLAGMSPGHAGEQLKERGYVHKNKKWYRIVESPKQQ